MKIKTFKCDKISDETLKSTEKAVNDFLKNHKSIDIKVSTFCNNFGAVLIYTVLYEEE
jgi:archaellum biogenesis ATPase FlaH